MAESRIVILCKESNCKQNHGQNNYVIIHIDVKWMKSEINSELLHEMLGKRGRSAQKTRMQIKLARN